MTVYTRADSPFYWLWLETTRSRERTDIRVGTTAAQKKDSRALAEDRYHQRMNELAARLYKLPSATPAIRFRKYAADYAAHTIPLHRGARREHELLAPLVAELGEQLLSAIDVTRVRAYMQRRTAAGLAATTVNREVDLLKAMLRDAVPKYLNASPIVGLRRLPTVKPRRRLLTAAEERKLLRVGDRVDRALLILGLDTLMRLSDLLDLTRADRDGHWLYVKDPKSGEPYEVALSPRAERALDRIPGKDAYYFSKFRAAKNPRDWPGAVRQRLERLCAAAKLPYGRKIDGITFHWGTRRTGATRLLVDRRVALPVVQRQGNWKQPDVLLEIYAEARSDDQLRAVGQRVLTPRSRARRKRA